MEKFYLKINGLNHDRYIGKVNNQMYDFYILNYRGYEPINDNELSDAVDKARKYYNSCVAKVKIDNFSFTRIRPDELCLSAENEAEMLIESEI